MNVNSAHKCLFKVYTRSIALGVRPVQIWQQGYHNNVCHGHFEVMVNFGQVFELFLGVSFADFEYSLFIWNVIKCYLMAYLCGTPNGCYIYWSCCKTLLCNCASIVGQCKWLALWSVQIFVYKLLWQHHSWFLLFYFSSHWEN